MQQASHHAIRCAVIVFVIGDGDHFQAAIIVWVLRQIHLHRFPVRLLVLFPGAVLRNPGAVLSSTIWIVALRGSSTLQSQRATHEDLAGKVFALFRCKGSLARTGTCRPQMQ